MWVASASRLLTIAWTEWGTRAAARNRHVTASRTKERIRRSKIPLEKATRGKGDHMIRWKSPAELHHHCGEEGERHSAVGIRDSRLPSPGSQFQTKRSNRGDEAL